MNEPLTLETSFTRKGVKYTQIRREGEVAIFFREKPNTWMDFEVIRIRVQKAMERELPNGEKVKYEATEKYPSDEDWGTLGWTLQSEEAAYRKMEEVQEAIRNAKQSSAKAALGASKGQDTGEEIKRSGILFSHNQPDTTP